eukprot:TRINITY_DN5152_c0_g1_i8.p1 TRINITY_DN5152_c0_g1~~TRINITY_DN5152_c0_g1_i8.p1  ORF type:complete len:600 (-),score=135.11 TRINITY_DN5152_c0_g1_i8:236-2035(-)
MERANNRTTRLVAHLCPSPTAGIRIGGSAKQNMAQLAAMRKYVFESAPLKITKLPAPPTQRPLATSWDVIVIGFGCAGACAALQASEMGLRVLLLDRFDGGGSTKRSGGVIYLGGGTAVQQSCGVADTQEQMELYLRQEVQDTVDEQTVRAFCQQSPENCAWLQRHGVVFESSLFPRKTSYPPDSAGLYTSGNEQAYPYSEGTTPAPRGHRVSGAHLTGHGLFAALEKVVSNDERITVQLHTVVHALTQDSSGSCVGVEACRVHGDEAQGMHTMLCQIGSSATFLDPTRSVDQQAAKVAAELEAVAGVPEVIRADRGVVIATGGFFFNQEMVRAHAPAYLNLMPLGNLGDDGSGVQLGLSAGGGLCAMERCSAWKFINPPFGMVEGVLVNASGVRVLNEDVYGASMADCLIQKHGGKGWLVIDQHCWDQCNQQCLDAMQNEGGTGEDALQPDQIMQGLANLHKNRKAADSLPELAEMCGMPAERLTAQMNKYNEDARAGLDSEFHKKPAFLRALEAPYYAINLEMTGNKYWPTPCMSLGGLQVLGATGEVLSANGDAIKGLHAAGRAAAGVCSNYYVSGLSLADCVFSGRRAGRACATK